MKRTCGEALMHLLESYGVELVFGIPGEHTLELYRGIEKSSVRAITPRNEQGASFMADGYARASGKPGVCALITGPGVTNAATGIGQAYADSIPMLVISSANDCGSLGKGWGRLHETTDLCAITRPLTAFSAMITHPDELPELIAKAFAVFHSRRPRPVHLAIPIDILEKPVEDDWVVSQTAGLPVPAAADISAAAERLATSLSTVLMLGGGARAAGDCLTRLAETLNAAVIASNAGKGVVSDIHPLSLGGGVISPAVQAYLAEAEVVLAIGTELGEADSFIFDLPIKGDVIRVDIDPARFHDAFPAAIPVLGDSGAACKLLLDALDGREIGSRGKNLESELAAVRRRQIEQYTPVEKQHIRLLDLLRDGIDDDAIVFGDIAQLVYTGTAAFPALLPATWFYPAGFGSLGCALPDAIGAKLADTSRQVLALVGDGGFMFTVNELATAVEEGLCIPIILWHNHCYAMIRDAMVKRGIPEIGVNPKAPDFIKLADAFGCRGTAVDSAAGFRDALQQALNADGPSIILVHEDDAWLRE